MTKTKLKLPIILVFGKALGFDIKLLAASRN